MEHTPSPAFYQGGDLHNQQQPLMTFEPKPQYEGFARKPVPYVLEAPNRPTDGYPVVNKDSQRRTKRAGFIWGWEVIFLALGCLAFTAIVLLLREFENKDLRAWKALVSINAVVSILSAIFRAALAVPISNGMCPLSWLRLRKDT